MYRGSIVYHRSALQWKRGWSLPAMLLSCFSQNLRALICTRKVLACIIKREVVHTSFQESENVAPLFHQSENFMCTKHPILSMDKTCLTRHRPKPSISWKYVSMYFNKLYKSQESRIPRHLLQRCKNCGAYRKCG
jgi:hypothetical protein